MLRGVRARPGQRLRAACGSRARLVAAATLAWRARRSRVAVAFGAASKIVEITDAKGDVTGVLDLQRASLNLASDGRLRAVVTVARKIDPREMLAGTGPPGSICVKVWTAEDADPTATRADRLVCVTARSSEELRASVFTQTAPGLARPRHLRAGERDEERAQHRPADRAELARPSAAHPLRGRVDAPGMRARELRRRGARQGRRPPLPHPLA